MPARLAPAFDPLALIELTRTYADDIRDGKYPNICYDENQRWHQRVYRDQRLDVWLISWLPSQGTQLHDHGGSSGAFTVVEGALTETVGARAVEFERSAGESVGFGPAYVHDVVNAGTVPALSVHAYSPPLSSMTYYDLEDCELRPLVTVQTDDPEREFTPADLQVAS